jgi:arylsulfatase A-like enzyme/Tfp pilus assembly protein PilF
MTLGCGRGKPEPVNVLLVSLDTVRPDHLGCYGNTDIETPNTDRIAAEGFVFTDAMTSVPLTLPSHASILTGLYPISHGARINGTFTLADRFTTLAEVLKANGYTTGAFVGSFVLDSRFGTAQGFDTYDDLMDLRMPAGGADHPERRASNVTTNAVRWLGEVSEPFLAFVHYYDPHTPYEPPPPFDSLYQGNPYDGEIAYTDRELGRLLDGLEQLDLMERTLIVVLSDHGEGLGDHGELEHGILIYESTMKVALIIRIPEAHPSSGDLSGPGRIDQPVELVDVFPTILSLVGIDSPDEIDGRSIVPLLDGDNLPRKVCYLESLYPHLAYKWSPLRGVRFGEWKYILAPEEELYNLMDDPTESRNLSAGNPTRIEMLKANLIEIARRDLERGDEEQRELSPEEAVKLKALGYVSPSGSSDLIDIEPTGTDPKHMIASLQDLLYVGMEAQRAGDLETALARLSELAEIDPMNPIGHLYLAETLMDMGRTASAEAEWHKVIEIDSTNTNALLRLGDTARSQGDLDRALFFYRMAADILPETPQVFSSMGSILMETGMIDSAMTVLRHALQIDPHDQIALVNMGLGYLALEQHDQALQWFHKTLKANPNHIKALMNIAFIYINRGDPDSTIAYLERASHAAPDDAKVLQNLGNAYRQAGMVAEAAGAFEAAVKIEPDNVMALFGLAATRAQQGDRQGSVALLERILRLDPNFTPARQALERLTQGS